MEMHWPEAAESKLQNVQISFTMNVIGYLHEGKPSSARLSGEVRSLEKLAFSRVHFRHVRTSCCLQGSGQCTHAKV